MTSTSRRPVARLSNPGDIVATVPTLCGFVPQDSVVVLSLRGRRRRLGLTVRLDLPAPEATQAAAELLAERVLVDGGTAAVVVVFAAERRTELVAGITAACEQHAVEVTEALHVHDGRWTSYSCAASCCPPEGTPVPDVPGLVQAESALDGRAVLPSREELVRSLAAPAFLEAEACAQQLDDATERWVRLAMGDLGAARATALARARDALSAVEEGRRLDLPTAAAVATALHDVLVRDEVATWAVDRPDGLLALAEQLARLTVPPYDAPVCALLAWVAYARGDGSRANVALDRALATDPAYSLALLLRQALDSALPPDDVRSLLRDTARALQAG